MSLENQSTLSPQQQIAALLATHRVVTVAHTGLQTCSASFTNISKVHDQLSKEILSIYPSGSPFEATAKHFCQVFKSTSTSFLTASENLRQLIQRFAEWYSCVDYIQTIKSQIESSGKKFHHYTQKLATIREKHERLRQAQKPIPSKDSAQLQRNQTKLANAERIHTAALEDHTTKLNQLYKQINQPINSFCAGYMSTFKDLVEKLDEKLCQIKNPKGAFSSIESEVLSAAKQERIQQAIQNSMKQIERHEKEQEIKAQAPQYDFHVRRKSIHLDRKSASAVFDSDHHHHHNPNQNDNYNHHPQYGDSGIQYNNGNSISRSQVFSPTTSTNTNYTNQNDYNQPQPLQSQQPAKKRFDWESMEKNGINYRNAQYQSQQATYDVNPEQRRSSNQHVLHKTASKNPFDNLLDD